MSEPTMDSDNVDLPSIAPGSQVTMHFRLSLPDGPVAESTFDEEPIEFVMGDGTLVEGLELALYGLRAGCRQTLTLTPDQAFGFHDAAKIHAMPRTDFPAGLELRPETLVEFTTPAGQEVCGLILQVDDDNVEVDFNHPLAGYPVVFEVEILSVHPPRSDTA